MEILVIGLTLLVAYLAISVFLGDLIGEKLGKDMKDKNNPWTFWLPVAAMIGIYMVIMTLKEIF